MSVELKIKTDKLQRQIKRAQVDALAGGRGFDLMDIHPRIDLILVHESPTEIVLEASMVGFRE